MNEYISATPLLDYYSDNIKRLVRDRKWDSLNPEEKVASIYDFVRDEIEFGYNENDNIPASKVLADGYGQCNTKATLFMALLRSVEIPCRLHGFTISKKLQKGAISGIWYVVTPESLIHSWVEILYKGSWLNAEGVILDRKYIASLQNKFKGCTGDFRGYGVATKSFENPEIDWKENSTYIQSEGINRDLGLYDTPDVFLSLNQQKIGWVRQLLFKHMIRHFLNRKVRAIRYCQTGRF